MPISVIVGGVASAGARSDAQPSARLAHNSRAISKRSASRVMIEAVRQALAADRLEQIVLIAQPPPVLRTIPIPAALGGYVVESARAADFDSLLWEGDDE